MCHGSQSPINNNSELANCLGRNNGMETIITYAIHADPTPKISADVAGTLRSQGGGGIVPPNVVYGFASKQQNASATEEMTPTLVASGYKEPLGVIAGNIIGRDNANGGNQVGIYESETSPTLTSSDRHAVIHNYVVRRLVPTECERLMGFPDGYTDVPHNGKPASNSARYKALGNSMATNVMQYIGQQIQNAVNFNQPKQETISMMAQSPTSLQTFLTCPRQYYAKYVTKEVKFEQNDHATFGDLVHKSIEAYLKHGEPLPTILEPMAEFLGKMTHVLVGAETKLAVDKQGNPVEFLTSRHINAVSWTLSSATLTATSFVLTGRLARSGTHRPSMISLKSVPKPSTQTPPSPHSLFTCLLAGATANNTMGSSWWNLTTTWLPYTKPMLKIFSL